MKIQIKKLDIIFFGTGNFAAYHLYTLVYCSAHKIVAIFTQETQFINKKKPFLSIYAIAQTFNIPVFKKNSKLNLNIFDKVKKFQIDIIIVVSYGLILPQNILNKPRFGCINVHASLLPKWRGPAPIQRALEYGDTVTGISIIRLNSGIDTGDILYSTKCQILPTDTTFTLSKKLAHIGSKALLKTIEKITLGKCYNIPQHGIHINYAYKLKKLEAQINWNDSAEKLERRIRAFNPWPVCHFQIKKIYIKVWEAKLYHNNLKNNLYALNKLNPSLPFIPGTILKTDSQGIYISTGSGIIILTLLQIPGKKKTAAKDLLNSYYKWFILNSVLK